LLDYQNFYVAMTVFSRQSRSVIAQ